MSSQYHIPMIIQGVYSCFEQQERGDFGGGRGVTGVVPVKECGAKENLWPDGRLFVQVCKRKGGGGGVVCLAERGGDGVDDVAEHLLEAGQVVRHRPQLPIQHGALHPVARS